jgi:hypothetical protein
MVFLFNSGIGFLLRGQILLQFLPQMRFAILIEAGVA